MRGQDSRYTLEAYRENLARKDRRAAASNDRIIAQSLERFNTAASLRNCMVPLHHIPMARRIYTPMPMWTDAQLTLQRVSSRRRVLEQHGVPPNAPLHDQLAEDLASYSWLREKCPPCPARICLRAIETARRRIRAPPLSGGYINHSNMGRERVLAAGCVLEWLTRKKVVLILMAHSCGPPAAGSRDNGAHLSHLPFNALDKALKLSLQC